MAYTRNNKRLAYDNIANGSATGIERIVNATARGGGTIDMTSRDGYDNVAVSADATSYTANRARELHLGAQNVSDSNAIWHRNADAPAGIGANAPDTFAPTSATTPGYTSTTSYTTAVGELLG